jgi:phosphohistidine phosphatase
MDLFLIRHAKAEDGALYASDEERPLTPDGQEQATLVGASLKQAGVSFDVIITSGLVRAKQTAALIATELGHVVPLEHDARLAPEGRPQEILDGIIAGRTEERVALVGHEPSMGRLLSVLLGKPGLSLSKGAAVRLAWDGKRARLVFTMKPKHPQPSPSLDHL